MLSKNNFYFKAHDNHRLYCEIYLPKKPKAILVFVHGLNEHTGRYEHVADYFKSQYGIYLFDQRGHGRSDGIRAHVDAFDDYIQDLRAFIQHVRKQHQDLKIFLIGHSMGGQIVLNYMAHYKNSLVDGVITSGANVKVAMKINPMKKFLGTKLSGLAPKFRLPSEIDAKLICRDQDVVKAYEEDPMVSEKISLKLASEILKNQENILGQAKKIKTPALLMHGGDDKICSSQGSEEFFDHLKSDDKSLKIFAGMYHEIFNEIGKEEVFATMGSWLKTHL